MNNNHEKENGKALLPFLAFIAIYLGAGIIYQLKGVDMAFYQFPIVTACFAGIVIAFIMTKGSVDTTFKLFAKGAGNEDMLTMLIIFMLAGAFSGVAAAMGGRDATVNLGLSIVPVHFLAAGIFIISAFMGTATGTSCGTISAIVPIAVGVADKAGLNVALVVGACIGGAMFGDNLSMISDTTISATRSQGCELKDKFRVNFFIALPAAICTLILLLIFGRPEHAAAIEDVSFNIIKVIPYIVVLIFALIGMNVFLVLTLGIIVAGVIGILMGDLTVPTFAQSIWSGITSMDETFYLCLLVAGLAEITRHNGGINWIISKLRGMMKGNKSAQVGIAALVSIVDCAVANNTVAILVSGSMAKDISREYKIDPRRTASLLDVFSCVFQGIIPYSAQPLIATALTISFGFAFTPMNIIPYIWYSFFLAVFGVISIFVPFADGICKKDPWNWEYDCAESKVEEKKKELEMA